MGSLAVVLGLRRVAPVVPGSLAAVLLGIAAVAALDLNVDIVGHIDGGLPSFGFPDVSLHQFGQLASGGIAVMLVGFAEGLGAAKTYAAREHYEIDVNRELLGLGGANLAAGLSSGMVVNGSLSKTAVNGGAGAHSQLSGLVVAALTIVTLLILTGLFEQLPEATLAAVVIAAVIELVDVGALVYALPRHDPRAEPDRRPAGLHRRHRRDARRARLRHAAGPLHRHLRRRCCCCSTARRGRTSRRSAGCPGSEQYADITRHPDNRRPRVSRCCASRAGSTSPTPTRSAAAMQAASADGVRAVVLDAGTIPFVDVTAARMFGELAGDLRRRGVEVLIVRDVGQVRDLLGREAPDPALQHVYPTVQAAVDAAAAHPVVPA